MNVIVVDFGCQYADRIVARLRALGCRTTLVEPSEFLSSRSTKHSTEPNLDGVVLSGGPASVRSQTLPHWCTWLSTTSTPTLGICYGHQLIAKAFGGEIVTLEVPEIGSTLLYQSASSALWQNIEFPLRVWMSHYDAVSQVPMAFEATATTDGSPIAAMQHCHRPIYSVQFHPEVEQFDQGIVMLQNFVHCCRQARP